MIWVKKMKRLLLLNGPNLNVLGKREKSIYGHLTLQDVEDDLKRFVETYDYTLDCYQSNYEGDLIERIQQADGTYSGIIFNPAAYTHTSVALRDAILSIDVPVVEVHISNIYNRETFRQKSLIAPACLGQITGFGAKGYRLAAMAFIDINR